MVVGSLTDLDFSHHIGRHLCTGHACCCFDETYMEVRKLPAKEVYKRLKFKESMQKKIAKAEDQIEKAYSKLHELQESCPHYDSVYKNRGSTGSWDRDDSFWREYECFDCGKKWQTDQSFTQDEKYPYAVDKTYER